MTSEVKLSAASGGGSISLKGPSSAGSDTDFLDTSGNLKVTGTTTVDGTSTLTGDVTTSGDVNFTPTTAGRSMMWDKSRDALGFKDNCIAEFGTGNDLQIYYDGTDTEITCADKINLRTDDQVIITNTANNATLAKFIDGGACELRHNDSQRLVTSSAGVDILGELYLADNNKIKVGTSGDLFIYHDGNTHIENENAHFYIKNKASSKSLIFGTSNTNRFQISDTGHFLPIADNSYDIGQSDYRLDDIYASSGTVNSSDRNQKNTITTSDLGLSFVNKLKPVSYKFNGKTRTHYGLIAQDVETTLSDISKPTTGFAGFIKEDIPNKLYVEEDEIPEDKKVGDIKTVAYTAYGLRYNEFISPLIKAVQELSAEVETLETKVAALEAS